MTENDLPLRSPEEERRAAFAGMHEAIQFSNSLGRKKRDVEEPDILKIHRLAMDEVLPVGGAGAYRHCNVGISRSSQTPPPFEVVPDFMQKLVFEMNKRFQVCRSGIACLPEAVRAMSFAYYALVRIHPFEDGNKRTAMLVTGIFLRRKHLRQILILPEQRNDFFCAYEAVNTSGNLAHLEKYFIDRFSERYFREPNKNSEALAILSEMKEKAQKEIGLQTGCFDHGLIWPEFKHPAFD